ncbi:hypothetical protein B0H67DRAFT_647215 [Lasiosphaeris hirsuta]|uniref:Uncharacterized protein n=1 Tax=Lasiosphaeris hirsuta TaxID=260670 RepID=A0AA40DQ07_9PEZI|nr:hypothetical protein B0H67DRAFT_647215 [Lasiosphaeris hirsuta]
MLCFAHTILEAVAPVGTASTDDEPPHAETEVINHRAAARSPESTDPAMGIFTEDGLCVSTCTYTYKKAEALPTAQPTPSETSCPQTSSPPALDTLNPSQCISANKSEPRETPQTASDPDVSYTDSS